jgi:hypothetical protein
MKYGYKFEILEGYQFEKGNQFAGYVSELYKIKQSVTSGHPWYTVSKLLLNSLYGRFGMNPVLDHSVIIDSSKFDAFMEKHTIVDFKSFGDKI